MLNIQELLVPPGLPNHPSRQMRNILFLTIHTTGNRSPGATAEAHARLQHRGNPGRQASWHYTIDANEIWRSFRDNQECWHTGNTRGNQTSIGLEICVNDRAGFERACDLTAQLTAELLTKHSLTIEHVRQHFDWSGKNCPRELRSGEWV